MSSGGAWGRITLAVPTVKRRRTMLAQLLVELSRLCDGVDAVIHTHEPGTAPSVDFPALVTAALENGREWVMFVEDDAWPAPSFGTAAIGAIKHADAASAQAVSMFSRSKRDLEIVAAEPNGFRWQAPSSFCGSLCVAVRAGTLVGMPAWAPSWYLDHPEHEHASDLLLGAWLSKRKARMLVRVPSLVQHRRGKSTLQNHNGARQSATFTAAFGEVPDAQDG